jgi:hypothetical protein
MALWRQLAVVATAHSNTAYRNSCLPRRKGRRNRRVLKKHEVKLSLGDRVSMYWWYGVRFHICKKT